MNTLYSLPNASRGSLLELSSAGISPKEGYQSDISLFNPSIRQTARHLSHSLDDIDEEPTSGTEGYTDYQYVEVDDDEQDDASEPSCCRNGTCAFSHALKRKLAKLGQGPGVPWSGFHDLPDYVDPDDASEPSCCRNGTCAFSHALKRRLAKLEQGPGVSRSGFYLLPDYVDEDEDDEMEESSSDQEEEEVPKRWVDAAGRWHPGGDGALPESDEEYTPSLTPDDSDAESDGEESGSSGSPVFGRGEQVSLKNTRACDETGNPSPNRNHQPSSEVDSEAHGIVKRSVWNRQAAYWAERRRAEMAMTYESPSSRLPGHGSSLEEWQTAGPQTTTPFHDFQDFLPDSRLQRPSNTVGSPLSFSISISSGKRDRKSRFWKMKPASQRRKSRWGKSFVSRAKSFCSSMMSIFSSSKGSASGPPSSMYVHPRPVRSKFGADRSRTTSPQTRLHLPPSSRGVIHPETRTDLLAVPVTRPCSPEGRPPLLPPRPTRPLSPSRAYYPPPVPTQRRSIESEPENVTSSASSISHQSVIQLNPYVSSLQASIHNSPISDVSSADVASNHSNSPRPSQRHLRPWHDDGDSWDDFAYLGAYPEKRQTRLYHDDGHDEDWAEIATYARAVSEQDPCASWR